MLSLPTSVNQTSPSDPFVIPIKRLFGVTIEYSVIVPSVVIRPILLTLVDGVPLLTVNHIAPSGPTVMYSAGSPFGIGYSVMTPAVVIRPMKPNSANQRAPSGPATIPKGE